MFTDDVISLCRHRISKAGSFLSDAEETLKLGMYENAANRSYYAIFHTIRALLALDEKDFSKHSGVISYFQLTYIKTGILPDRLSKILKSAYSLRTESDYQDYFEISDEDVALQVSEARYFFETVRDYIDQRIQSR